MKIKLAIILLFILIGTASAQTTAFNFQGRLNDGANPANGRYDLQIKLFDAITGGNQIGATVDRPNLALINGVFSTTLDFGAAAFTSGNRFLEISVRPFNSPNAYVVLGARQQILSVPLAVRATSAANADNAGTLEGQTSGDFIKNGTAAQTANFNVSGNGFVGGNLGIGTTIPGAKLTVQSPGDSSYGIQHRSDSVSLSTYIGDGTLGLGGWIGTRSNHPLYFFTNEVERMTLLPSGQLRVRSTGVSAISAETTGGSAIAAVTTAEGAASPGVFGVSIGANGVGVRGDGVTGVYGKSFSVTGIGVTGESNSANGYGVYASNPSGVALFSNGNAGQPVDKGGFVKAMIYVTRNASIIRCYNGVTGQSTGNCGFTVIQIGTGTEGVYNINFGFPVNNRFVSVVADNSLTIGTSLNWGANFRFNGNNLEVFTFQTNDPDNTYQQSFMAIVY